MANAQERWGLILPYLNAAQGIVGSTQVTFAKECWKYLLAHGVVAFAEAADERSCTMVQVGAAKVGAAQVLHPALFLYPLIAEDESIGGVVGKLCRDPNLASYWRGISAIAVKTWRDDVSDFFKGCTLLHEAGHVIRAEQLAHLGQVRDSLDAIAVEEFELQALTAALWKERGGQRYAALIQKVVRYIFHITQGAPVFQVPSQAPYAWGEELRTIFGQISTEVLPNYVGGLWMFAYMQYYQQYHCSIAYRMGVQMMIETGSARIE